MSLLQLVKQSLIKSQYMGNIRKRGIITSLINFKYSIPKHDDPTANLKRRMDKVYKQETYDIRRFAGGVDKQAIDRITFETKECLKKTHDYPKLRRCFDKVKAETYDIEDHDTRRQMQDTLKEVQNLRPRKQPME